MTKEQIFDNGSNQPVSEDKWPTEEKLLILLLRSLYAYVTITLELAQSWLSKLIFEYRANP